MRRMTIIAAIALAFGSLFYGGVGHVFATPPPPPRCSPYPECLDKPCPDPSKVCPPDDASDHYVSTYAWQEATTGTEVDQEFTGTSLPSGWFAQYEGTPGGCIPVSQGGDCNDTWSTANTVVGGGAVSMTTTCAAPGCTSGGIGQTTPTTTFGTATAVEARVTGASTNNTSWWSDNVLQMGQYCNNGVFNGTGCAWPPELDYMENGTGTTSSYNAFLHCYSGPDQVAGDPDNDNENNNTGDTDNDGDEDQIAQMKTPVTLDVGAWTTYELDWTSSFMDLWATQDGDSILEGSWLKSDTINAGGYYDTACQSYWPPSPNAALSLFFQSQIIGSSSPTVGTFGVQVDWVAQQPLA